MTSKPHMFLILFWAMASMGFSQGHPDFEWVWDDFFPYHDAEFYRQKEVKRVIYYDYKGWEYNQNLKQKRDGKTFVVVKDPVGMLEFEVREDGQVSRIILRSDLLGLPMEERWKREFTSEGCLQSEWNSNVVAENLAFLDTVIFDRVQFYDCNTRPDWLNWRDWLLPDLDSGLVALLIEKIQDNRGKQILLIEHGPACDSLSKGELSFCQTDSFSYDTRGRLQSVYEKGFFHDSYQKSRGYQYAEKGSLLAIHFCKGGYDDPTKIDDRMDFSYDSQQRLSEIETSHPGERGLDRTSLNYSKNGLLDRIHIMNLGGALEMDLKCVYEFYE